MAQTDDGGSLIGGYTATLGGGYFDFYRVIADENGDSMWTRTYGGKWQEMASGVYCCTLTANCTTSTIHLEISK